MTGAIRLPLVAATLLSLTAPAFADPDYSTARVSVNYKLTELTTAEGRRDVRRRINAAIANMCGAPQLFTRDETEALAQCRAEALGAVMPQYEAALARASTTLAAR